MVLSMPVEQLPKAPCGVFNSSLPQHSSTQTSFFDRDGETEDDLKGPVRFLFVLIPYWYSAIQRTGL